MGVILERAALVAELRKLIGRSKARAAAVARVVEPVGLGGLLRKLKSRFVSLLTVVVIGAAGEMIADLFLLLANSLEAVAAAVERAIEPVGLGGVLAGLGVTDQGEPKASLELPVFEAMRATVLRGLADRADMLYEKTPLGPTVYIPECV